MKFHKIEENVPFPDVISKIKYPWPERKVGNSVFIEAEEVDDLYKLERQLRNNSRKYGIQTGKKFKVMVKRADKGFRVWRMK